MGFEPRHNEAAPPSELLIVQPPPPAWLETRQRAACDGGSALATYQGLIADEIIVPQSAIDASDPVVLVRAVLDYASLLENALMFLPGEYAPEALYARWVMHYLDEARSGGHAHYVAASGWDDIKVRSAIAGLRSMSADPYLKLLTDLRAAIETDPRRGKKIKAGRDNKNPLFKLLDQRFGEIEKNEPIAPRFKIWIKSLRKLTVVPDSDVQSTMQRIVAANPLYTRRRSEAETARGQRERTDPAYATARALCEQAGMRFLSLAGRAPTAMRAHWPEGPDKQGLALNVVTDRGLRTALVYEEGAFTKKRVAVLVAPGEPLPAGSVSLSKGEYDSIRS